MEGNTTEITLITHRVGQLEKWRDNHETVHLRHEELHSEEREKINCLSEKIVVISQKQIFSVAAALAVFQVVIQISLIFIESFLKK